MLTTWVTLSAVEVHLTNKHNQAQLAAQSP